MLAGFALLLQSSEAKIWKCLFFVHPTKTRDLVTTDTLTDGFLFSSAVGAISAMFAMLGMAMSNR